MNIIKTFVKRPVTTTMLILIFMAFGILSFTNLQIDMMPKMDIPIALVSTSYSGAGSEEMENLITKPLEGVLGTVPGVKNITSSSSNGSSMVMLEFEDGTDLDQAAIDMREKVDLIKGMLPSDASDPMVLKIDINQMSGSSIIGIKNKNGNLTELQNVVESKIQNRLERSTGVASISSAGGSENEIQVTLNLDALRGYGISESTVMQLLYAENVNTPTGTVQQGNQELALRVQGQYASIADIQSIPLYTSTGQTVFVSDVAKVEEVIADREAYSFINGSPAITLTVQKQSTANTVEVSDGLKKEISKLQKEFPDLEIVFVYDPAEYINASIDSVANTAVIGGLLAVIVLFVFLKDVRTTLIVAVAMPISIVMTFALMYFTGMTINIMSLGGLTLGVGMLVDNSIVVIESIYRKLENGESRYNAAIDGAQEVAMSVIASTLTTIVVFLPITFSGGLTSQIFNELSFTISFSLISSLFASLTFVPMASALFLITEEEKLNVGIIYRILTKFNNSFDALQEGYKKLLDKALSHRKIVLIIVIVFVILTGVSVTRVGAVFMPSSDQGMIQVSLNMPSGTVIDEILAKSIEVSDIINEVPEISAATLSVGSSGGMSMMSSGGTASFWVDLVPKEDRNRSAKEIEVDLNNRFKQIAGAEVTAVADESSMGSYGGAGVSVTIKGDELDVLEEIVYEFSQLFEEIEGVTKVETSIQATSPQANIVIDRQKAAGYGIQSASVASIISTQVNGSSPTTLKADGTELDIRISGDTDAYKYLDSIQNILIPTSYGTAVPLYEIADFTLTYPPATINRENQERYVTVTATTDGTTPSEITKVFEEKLNSSYIMPANYSWAYTGSQEQMDETFSSLILALVMAILLVYMVMAAEFESFLYPFIVLFSIPIAISGGIFGLSIVGEPISITSFLGMIMLAGLVINSAIIIIDYTNLHVRENGLSPREALLIAGPIRLRPIVMSVATTTLGLIPMAISKAEGAEMMNGLALFVIFGLLFSTLVTLIFIPTVYLSLTTKANKRKIRKEEKRLAKIEKYNRIKFEQNNNIEQNIDIIENIENFDNIDNEENK